MPVLQTVAETPTFTNQADKIFTEDEKIDVINSLAADPTAGELIKGTGGVRKVRFPLPGCGKSGGARVIYYYIDENFPIYALLAYSKSKKEDLTDTEKKSIKNLVTTLKNTRNK